MSFSNTRQIERCSRQYKVFGALLTNFLKAFDCLSHELRIAKLNAYGFTSPALKLVHAYLSDRKQITRVIIHMVHDLKYFLEYLKILYLVHCYLTYFW